MLKKVFILSFVVLSSIASAQDAVSFNRKYFVYKVSTKDTVYYVDWGNKSNRGNSIYAVIDKELSVCVKGDFDLFYKENFEKYANKYNDLQPWDAEDKEYSCCVGDYFTVNKVTFPSNAVVIKYFTGVTVNNKLTYKLMSGKDNIYVNPTIITTCGF